MENTTPARKHEPPHDHPPGTVHLVDLERRMRAKHGSGGEHDILLVPEPSQDPDDPLNWSPKRKALSTATLSIYTTVIAMGTAVTYAIIVPMSKATELSVNDLNAGFGYVFLLAGWGGLIWQPLALQYGKRPVYLLSLLAHTAVMIWAPYTTTNGQWIANKIIQGFFGAPVSSLGEISVADVYFTHERGRYMAIYTMSIIGGVYIAPIIFGFVNDGQGWKWVLFWMGIFSGVALIVCFFFMEETNYYHERHETLPDSSPHASSSLSPDHQLQEKRTLEEINEPLETALAPRKRKTAFEKMRLFDTNAFQRPNHLARMMLRPLLFLGFPVILYAGFSWGSAVVWHAVFNGTASLILGQEPYNFSSSMVGLSFVSGFIGVALGSLYTGLLGDHFVLSMARRNGGWMEPEHRQWLFLLSVVLLPASLILWGVGAAHRVPWPALLIGECLLSVTNTIGTQLSVTYAIDSYRALSGEAMVTVVLIRNTMVFAIGYGVTPWVLGMGYQGAFLVAAFVGFAQVLLFLVFVRWGRTLRARSAKRYERFKKETD